MTYRWYRYPQQRIPSLTGYMHPKPPIPWGTPPAVQGSLNEFPHTPCYAVVAKLSPGTLPSLSLDRAITPPDYTPTVPLQHHRMPSVVSRVPTLDHRITWHPIMFTGPGPFFPSSSCPALAPASPGVLPAAPGVYACCGARWYRYIPLGCRADCHALAVWPSVSRVACGAKLASRVLDEKAGMPRAFAKRDELVP